MDMHCEPTQPCSKRVLIVDDEQAIREIFTEILQTTGWTVDAAASADEAMVLYSTNNYDLLLFDYAMPGVDGGQLHRSLSESFGYGRRVSSAMPPRMPPVLFVTGYYDCDEVQKLVFGERTVGVVRKPVSCKKLTELAQELYDFEAQRRERRVKAISRISGRLTRTSA